MAILTVVEAAAFVPAAADRIAVLIERAIAARRVAHVALTGGTTIGPVYEALADPNRPWRGRIDWNRVHLYWGDERQVPPGHADSNFGMAKRALVSRVPIPADQVHRMRGELPDAAEAAREYEAQLLGTFDVMLLGLGEDAHIASLFPEAPGTTVWRPDLHGPAVIATTHLGRGRITLTPTPILSSRHILVLVKGEQKAEAVEAALELPLDVARYPAQMLRDAGARVEWIIERAAALRLRGVPPE